MRQMRQIVIESKEQLEAKKLTRALRLQEQTYHLQKRSKKMRMITTIILIGFSLLIGYMITVATVFNQSTSQGTGSASNGASKLRGSNIDQTEGPLSERYFNIRW